MEKLDLYHHYALIDIPLNPHMFLVFVFCSQIHLCIMYVYIYVCVSLLLKLFIIIIVPIQLPKLGSIPKFQTHIMVCHAHVSHSFPQRILRQSNMVVENPSFIDDCLVKTTIYRRCYFPFEGINMNYP